MKTSCIVVGGGVIGAMTALELAAAGIETVIVERGRFGREASWAGGGILSPLHPWRDADAVNAMARWSQQRYVGLCRQLADETGIDPECQISGLLIVGTADAPAARAWAARFGYRFESITGSQAVALEPRLRPPDVGCLWLPDCAQVRNPRLLQALQAAVVARGVTLQLGTELTGLVLEQGRCCGIRTADGGRRLADHVVIAAGAWTASLLAPLGVELPVKPVRGQMIMYTTPTLQLQRILLSGDRYVIPRRDGHVLVGSTVEQVGFLKAETPDARRELVAAAEQLVPALATATIAGHWSGLRPGSPDGIPFIGRVPGCDGLWVNAGHFRNGLTLAPGAAHLLVDLMLERQPILPAAAYAATPPTTG